MKFYLISICILFYFIGNAQVQRKDSIKILNNDQIIDPRSRVVHRILVKSKTDSNTLIIINENIYKAGSNEMTKFDVKDLTLVQRIVDTSSKSGVKKILIYKTIKQ
ncbi:MAG: hypothetical protein JST29_03745 [Bacteroidetes bacterium]|nr:hypothetical protein [Bacteroidota bacterium]MBS1591381.1 hypothetical protein [Bacteroidota bacterium]